MRNSNLLLKTLYNISNNVTHFVKFMKMHVSINIYIRCFVDIQFVQRQFRRWWKWMIVMTMFLYSYRPNSWNWGDCLFRISKNDGGNDMFDCFRGYSNKWKYVTLTHAHGIETIYNGPFSVIGPPCLPISFSASSVYNEWQCWHTEKVVLADLPKLCMIAYVKICEY